MTLETSGGSLQERYRKLHTQALFDDISPAEARNLLIEVLEGCNNPFDKARAARDLGKIESREGSLNWSSYLETSIDLLGEARETGCYDEVNILREEGASFGIYG